MYVEPPKLVDLPVDRVEFRYVAKQSPSLLLAKKFPYPPPARRSSVADHPSVEVKEMPAILEDLPMVFMKLPPGKWMYQRLEYASHPGYNIPLTLKSNSKVELGFSSPGVYLRENSHFKSVILSEPHVVPRSELESLAVQDFFTDVRVEILNGKHVLVKSGRFDGTDIYELEFLHNPDDSDIWVTAEISFRAPAAEYKKHIGDVKKALQTIRWAKRLTYVP